MKQTHVGWTVAAMMLALLLAALDQTIVATAMPTIVAQLKGMEMYSWVFTTYMLASTAVMPIVGKLSDLYGRKRFFLLGLAVFMAGSALCGTATTMMELVIYRGLQGLGAGVLMPVSFTIIFEIFPPEKRGKMQGLFGTVFGLSSVLGPVAGAYLTEYLSWPWIFYINLPLGVVSFMILLYSLVESQAQQGRPRVDYLGALSMTVAVVSLLLALEMGGKVYAWSSLPILGLFGVCLVFLALFFSAERRAEDPMLPPSLFRQRLVTVIIAVTFLQGVAMMGGVSYIPLFVQGVQGGTAANAGNILMPMMLGLVAGAQLGGFGMNRFPYRTIVTAAMLLLSLGSFLMTTLTPDTSAWLLTLYMVIYGLGIGPLMPVATTAVQDVVKPTQRGVATSSVAFFRSIGGAVGVTVMGVIITFHLTQGLVGKLPPGPIQEQLLRDPQVLLQPDARAAIPQDMLALLKLTLTESIHYVFWLAFAAALIGLVSSIFLGNARLSGPRRQMRPQRTAEQP